MANNKSKFYTEEQITNLMRELNISRRLAGTVLVAQYRQIHAEDPPLLTPKRPSKARSKYASEDEIELIMQHKKCTRAAALKYIRNVKIQRQMKKAVIPSTGYELYELKSGNWIKLDIDDSSVLT